MSTRFTTDRRAVRQTPTFTIVWRKASGESNGSTDYVHLFVDWRTVASRVDGGGVGNWNIGSANNSCLDTHADGTWETCTRQFNLGDTRVQDVRVYVLNSTVGKIHLNQISLKDGDAT